MIRCVMLDLGNVLVQMNAPKFFSAIRRHSRVKTSPSELFAGRHRHLFVDFEAGILEIAGLYMGIRKAYRLQGLGFEDFSKLLCDFLEPDLKMLELKMKLRQKDLWLALVTNISRYQFQYLWREYPGFVRWFDSVAASYELGVRKPDPEIWISSFDELGVKAEECLFVDDILTNVEAFRNLGGLGFHYDVADSAFRIDKKKLERTRRNLFDTLSHLGLI